MAIASPCDLCKLALTQKSFKISNVQDYRRGSFMPFHAHMLCVNQP